MRKHKIEGNQNDSSCKKLLKEFNMMDTASDFAKQYGEELREPKPDKTLIEHLQGASATQFNCIAQRGGGQLLNAREYLDKKMP